MLRLLASLAWLEICTANRIAALGRSITAKGQAWADIALRRYGHFSGKRWGRK